VIPDVGLGYLATALRQAGYEVDIFQEERARDAESFMPRVLEFQPDYIGVKIFSLEISSARETIRALRRRLPETPIIIGGPHVSIAPPGELLEYFAEADFAIRGEGEIGLPLLVDRLEGKGGSWESIPGLIRRLNGGVRANPSTFHRNLDDFGFPAWDLIDPTRYDDRWFFWAKDYPGAPVLATRGCPYHCPFCAQNIVNGKVVRRRSPEHIVAELKYLHDVYGVKHFDFIDDHLLLNPGFLRRLARRMIEELPGIRWTAAGARLDLLDRELIELIDRSGCEVLAVGLESGSPRVLDYMRKNLSPRMAREKLFLIERYSRIKVIGLFILGFPTETVEEVRQTIDYALRLPLHMANFNTYIIMPGCEEYERLVARGEVERVDWEQIGLDSHQYAPRGMSQRQLKALYREALLRFYGRPSRLFSVLFYSRNRIPHLAKKALRKIFWYAY